MRAYIAVIALFAVPVSTWATSTEDHLIPRWPHNELPNYYTLLQRKMMVTPADYGRLIVIPSPASFGEESVAVWSAQSRFRATYTKASRNIWYATMYPKDPDYGLKRYGAVNVSRADIDIPASTALAIRRAWTDMLRNTAPLGPSKNSERVVLDATSYEFVLSDGRKTLVGVAMGGVKGNKTAELRKIGDLLIEFCQSDPARRVRLARQIETRSNRLSSTLGALPRERPNPYGGSQAWMRGLGLVLVHWFWLG